MNHKCPVTSLGVHDAWNSSVYFKQFYHMCSEILKTIYILHRSTVLKIGHAVLFYTHVNDYFRVKVTMISKHFELKLEDQHPCTPNPPQ